MTTLPEAATVEHAAAAKEPTEETQVATYLGETTVESEPWHPTLHRTIVPAPAVAQETQLAEITVAHTALTTQLASLTVQQQKNQKTMRALVV